MGKMTTLLNETSNLISRLNETLYFYVDIETKIPWLVILIMYLLYKVLNMFLEDGKLSSAELVKLLAGYLFILLAIAGSYANLDKIKETAKPEYTFFMVTSICVGLIILVAFLGAGDFKVQSNKKKLVLIALYTPIVLLVLSNGSILENRLGSLKAVVPRSNSIYINLPSEYDEFYLGGKVPDAEVNKAIGILNEHISVRDSVLVGHMDHDRLIKPYAFIELEPGTPKEDRLKISIDDHFRRRAPISKVSVYLYPQWYEFVDQLPRGGDGKPRYKVLQRRAKNWSDLFSGIPGRDAL